MSAEKEALGQLHEALATKFKKMLEGNEVPSAAELGVIRQFLKDNNINVDGQAAPTGLQGLADVLPFQVDPEAPIRRTGGE